MATDEVSDRASLRLPLHWRIASALGWAMIFWAVGHVVSPALNGTAEGLSQQIGAWTSSHLNQATSSSPDLGGIVFGILFGIIQIPLVIIFSVIVLAVGLVAILVRSLDQTYASAVVGFFFGFRSGEHALPFRPLAIAFEKGGDMLRASVEVFTYPRLSDKLWAVMPLILGILAVGLVWGFGPIAIRQTFHSEMTPHRAVTVLRYEPGPGWREAAWDKVVKIELKGVEVEPGRIACTLFFQAVGSQPATIKIDNRTYFSPLDRNLVLTRQEPRLRGDDGRIAIGREYFLPPGEGREGTLYFERPKVHEEQWLLLLLFSENHQPTLAQLVFDLREKAP